MATIYPTDQLKHRSRTSPSLQSFISIRGSLSKFQPSIHKPTQSLSLVLHFYSIIYAPKQDQSCFFSSSNNVDLKSIRFYSNGSLFGVPKFAGSSNGSSKVSTFGIRILSQAVPPTPSNNGLPSVSVSCRSSRAGLFQWAAVLPRFTSRGITKFGNPVESVSQDYSSSVSDLAPRIKFERLDKTAKNIMQILDKEDVEEVRMMREIPDIKPGYIVQLKVEVPENKRRVSILKGIVIARRNAGLNTTFRIRRLVAGVGVESLFLLYSPNIKVIKVLDKKKVRRAKLYYLRDKMNALKKQ